MDFDSTITKTLRTSCLQSNTELRKVNVALCEEAHKLRRVCDLLDVQYRTALQRTQFQDEIIKEMRRQLKQAKTKVIKY